MYAYRTSFNVLLLRVSDKIALESYEYKIHTYFTPLMDVNESIILLNAPLSQRKDEFLRCWAPL